MDSGIVTSLVVEPYAIAVSTLRVDIYSLDSWEFTAEVIFELLNVIVLAMGVTMDFTRHWSNNICLVNLVVPRPLALR